MDTGFGQTIHVLVVEDSSDYALLIIHELSESGFQVVYERVQTAEKLERALGSENWNIVLSDYSMPQYTAIDVLKFVKEKNPDLPCIIISGTIGEETAVEVMQAGAQDFFVKGRLNRLPAAVKRQLAEAENTRQKRRAEQELRETEQRLAIEREEALKQQTSAREKIEILYHEAQESNRIKEEFLTTLSHELRTPMTAITGWADLLFSGTCKIEDYQKAFASIHRNAHAQNKLIDDVLDLSRIITGKLKVESLSVNLIDVSKMAIESLRPLIETKKISLNTSFDASAGNLIGDPMRLKQVVWNILSNAVKFTPVGGHIAFDIKRVGPLIELRISDSGQGIDHEFLPHVFDRFRQADGSLTRHFGGLGLGLALVRHIVEIHGGQVEATSDGIGKGTTVIVTFPMTGVQLEATGGFGRSESKSEIQVERAQQLLKGLFVLVVDDSPDNCVILNAVLKRHGAEVVIAESGREAFNQFSERHFDVLLCDIEMPEENGYELIQRIRKSGHNGQIVPAAAVTAHVRTEDVAKALEAGFQQHIAKPFKESILIHSVAQLATQKFKDTQLSAQ